MFEGWQNSGAAPNPEQLQKWLRRPKGWKGYVVTREEVEAIAMHTFHPGGSVYDPRRRESIVFSKTDGHCGYCWDKPATTVDHIVPSSRGGSNAYVNVIGACFDCNNEKAAMSLEEFRRKRRVKAFPFETYEKRNTSTATEAAAGRG